jgi:hypothetical protein
MNSACGKKNFNWTVIVTGWHLITATMHRADKFKLTKRKSGVIVRKSGSSKRIFEETASCAAATAPAISGLAALQFIPPGVAT